MNQLNMYIGKRPLAKLLSIMLMLSSLLLYPSAHYDTAAAAAPSASGPAVKSAKLQGSVITLEYDRPLQALGDNAASQFTVMTDGAVIPMLGVFAGTDAAVVWIGLGEQIPEGQTVSVYYSQGAAPIRDDSGAAAYPFSQISVQNGPDLTPPSLQSVYVGGSQITLTFDEPLRSTLLPDASSFYIFVGGAPATVQYMQVTDNQLMLTLSAYATDPQNTVLTYMGGTPGLADAGGNEVGFFSSAQANQGGAAAGTVSSVAADGTAVMLTFAQLLQTGAVPAPSLFTVKVGGVSRAVVGTSVGPRTVTLQLSEPVGANDVVTVSYAASPGVTGIKNADGTSVADFAGASSSRQGDGGGGSSMPSTPVTNGGGAGASGASTIADYLANTSKAVSAGGQSAKRYTIPDEKITSAFNAQRGAGTKDPAVVFTVPDSEPAAIVALSFVPLEQESKLSASALFAVRFKGWTYELPVNALDYSQIGQTILEGGGEGMLQVEIEPGDTPATAALRTALGKQNAEVLAGPVHFHAAIVNSKGQTPINEFRAYTNRSLTVPSSLNGRDTAAVWLDPATGLLAYAPTRVTPTAAGSLVTFKRPGNSAYAVIKGGINYTDIAKHWARNDILLLANKYIAEGRTAAEFQPDKPITRGEFAAYIVRGLGLSGDRQAAAKFKDVNNATAMAAYIGAASKAGIVLGGADGNFRPNNPISRQEIAVMADRAAKTAGAPILLQQGQATILGKFKDSKAIASWAGQSLAKAVEAGIINGITADTVHPQDNATRAQAVVMIERLLKYANFLDT